MFTFPENWSEMTAEEQQQWVIEQAKAKLESETAGLKKSRDTVLAEKKSTAELLKAFKALGKDPEELQEQLQRLDEIENSDLLKKGKVDELVNKQVAKLTAEFEAKLKAATDENETLRSTVKNRESALAKTLVEGGIQEGINNAGLVVRGGALEDVLARGSRVFRFDPESGKAIAMDGEKPLFDKAGEPLSFKAWADQLREAAPHLFDETKKSGTSSPGGGGGPTPPGTVAKGDQKAFGANLDDIAAGKVKVV